MPSDYGTSTDLDDVDLVPPFGATIAGVKALVPEVILLTGEPVVGKYGVHEVQVHAWLNELSGSVAMRLDGWERLAATPTPTETAAGEVAPDSDREQLRRAARTIIHNGVGSYLEAARHPERADVNETSYAGLLWSRYKTGLDELTAWLAARLSRGGSDDELGDLGTGIAFNFPEPLFGDGLRF